MNEDYFADDVENCPEITVHDLHGYPFAMLTEEELKDINKMCEEENLDFVFVPMAYMLETYKDQFHSFKVKVDPSLFDERPKSSYHSRSKKEKIPKFRNKSQGRLTNKYEKKIEMFTKNRVPNNIIPKRENKKEMRNNVFRKIDEEVHNVISDKYFEIGENDDDDFLYSNIKKEQPDAEKEVEKKEKDMNIEEDIKESA